LKPFTEVNRHPIIPNEEEIELNTRARSAKLITSIQQELFMACIYWELATE
jgi:16S rRNA C1402 N4-methylase RsmH